MTVTDFESVSVVFGRMVTNNRPWSYQFAEVESLGGWYGEVVTNYRNLTARDLSGEQCWGRVR